MAQSYPCLPEVEARRLADLHRLDLLDTPHEAEFDAVVAIACRLFDCPISTVTLVDDHRQWFKARAGLDNDGCPREHSLCATAMYDPDIMVIEDLRLDARFADNPVVTSDPRVRFYAGVPLRPGDTALPGIGTLCIMDTRVRRFSSEDAALLQGLATMVCAIMRARASAAAMLTLSADVQTGADLIHLQNTQLRQAERMVGVGSWRLDLRDQSIQWSDHVFAIYGIPPGPTPAYDDAMAPYPPESRARLAALIQHTADHGEAFDFESDFTALDGAERRVRAMGEAQVVGGVPIAIVGVFQDVTEAYERERRLRKTAGTDVLTGLPNRREFENRLAAAFAHARAHHCPLALLLLDLDGFKVVNDTLGHDAGDDVLRSVATHLRASPLDYAFAARLGGDEFVLMLTRPRDCVVLETIVETVLGAVRSSVARGSQQRTVTVTVGAAMLDDTVESPMELLRRADVALYDSKRDRRGTGRVYGSPAMLRAHKPRARLRSVG